MEKTEYHRKMDLLLEDRSTYDRLGRDPTTTLNNKCHKLVDKLVTNGKLDQQIAKKLKIKGAIPPRIHGLPKDHKVGIPMRPIVSTIDSPVSELSKYINTILRPLYERSEYNVRNSFEFKEYIKTVTLEEDDILVSFDVNSLFTNIPLDKAVEIVESRWDEICTHTNMTLVEFLEVLKFCIIGNNYFLYNGLVFKQSSGLAMGNPLSPALADVVMEQLFKIAIEKLPRKPTFIKKYVDDVIMAIPREFIDITKNIFESFDNRIKFSVEVEDPEHGIAFLDMRLIRHNQRINTTWYSKESSSGRIINYLSSHPEGMKVNTAKSLISRILNLSDEQYKQGNVNKIYNILRKNSYPRRLIDRLVNQVWNIDSGPSSRRPNNDDQNPQQHQETVLQQNMVQ